MANFGDYYQLVQTDDFKKWFWYGQNGNTLIKYLNSDKGRQYNTIQYNDLYFERVDIHD